MRFTDVFDMLFWKVKGNMLPIDTVLPHMVVETIYIGKLKKLKFE